MKTIHIFYKKLIILKHKTFSFLTTLGVVTHTLRRICPLVVCLRAMMILLFCPTLLQHFSDSSMNFLTFWLCIKA